MRYDANPKPKTLSMDVNVRRLVLVNAFRLGMVWDLLTTFLGSLIILGSSGFIALGLSLVGTLTVGALNFSTLSIWQRQRGQQSASLLLRLIWACAIAFDFWTSLTCNTTYIALQQFEIGQSEPLLQLFGQLNFGQMLIVFFVTLLTVLGPMTVSAMSDRKSRSQS